MSEIILVENALTVEILLKMYKAVGWGRFAPKQVQKALDNSLFTVVAFHKDIPVGIARLIGDGVMDWYIKDVAVLPKYQNEGIGSMIMEKLLEHIKANMYPSRRHVTIVLMSAKGKEAFYEKFGFHQRPNDIEGAGMILRMQPK